MPSKGLRESWRECLRKMSPTELSQLSQILNGPRICDIASVLLPFLKKAQHCGCSEFARKHGLDKGNFSRYKQGKLLELLAFEPKICHDVYKELSELTSEFKPKAKFAPSSGVSVFAMQCHLESKQIVEALKCRSFDFLLTLDYPSIGPGTGRQMALINFRPTNWWGDFFLTIHDLLSEERNHPQAGISFGLFLLGLSCSPDIVGNLFSLLKVVNKNAEYIHSVILGLSYNNYTLLSRSGFLAQFIEVGLKNFEDPLEFARGVAEFELKRGAGIQDIFSRVQERFSSLIKFLPPPDNISLGVVELMPLIAMPSSETEKILPNLPSLLTCLSSLAPRAAYPKTRSILEWLMDQHEEIL
jgi:hypothetical protein